ncbi:hypothetical protein [Psychrobacter sp. 16-MNA-CIBAN-0192]|uniref:hypothetical protein n=1 Tax=Psychrobacter sp. 16-MNA-CIBAN-0192 TaxID=3140448 RepID=UPI003324D364
MDSVSITELRKRFVVVFPDIVKLCEIYIKNIRPYIKPAKILTIHQKASLARLTLYIKTDKNIQLVNNVELICLLKGACKEKIDQQLLSQKLMIVSINKEEFCIQSLFYELIEIIAKHQKKLDIKSIYEQLDRCLTLEMKQQMFGKNIFAAATFCKLIKIHEQTYYKRCKKGAENAES